MATSAGTRPTIVSTSERWQKLFDKPGIILFLVFLLLYSLYLYFVDVEFNIILFGVFFFTPFIPIIILENKWTGALARQEKNSASFYQLIRRNRWTFIAAGFVYSFIQLLTGLLLQFLILNNSGSNVGIEEGGIEQNESDWFNVILFVIASMIIGVYIGGSLYRIRAEEHTSGKRYNYVSAPSQIITLASYGMIGVNFDLSILWLAQILNKDNDVNLKNYPLDHISSQIIIPLLVMNMILFISIIFSAKILPHFIAGSLYRRPTREELKKASLRILVFISVISVTMKIALDDVNQTIVSNQPSNSMWHYIFILAPLVMSIPLINSLKMSGQTCEHCNLLLDDNGFCNSCNTSETDILPVKLSISTPIKHPYCPSCGKLWNTLSRRCTNAKCNFTIILSCEKCAQTLNPLWEKCNLCGEKRKPIPLLALQTPGSPSYARNQAFLMVLIAFIFPAMVLQISILVTTLRKVLDKVYTRSALVNLFDDIGRVIILLIAIIAAFYIIITSFVERKRPMMLVGNRYATAPGSILVLLVFFSLVVFSMRRVFTEGLSGIFLRIFLMIFAVIMTLLSLGNYYKSLINFRPVIGFDPSLATDEIGN